MQKKLVSIITPCYNNGNIIHRLLDSILMQDYPYIEMLVVDDGSTDMSKEIINTYISRFISKGFILEYRYQKNQGQSVAINNALKWVKGEYLLWPDADDFYNRSDAISCMVDCFKKLPKEYGMIKTIPKYVNETSLTEEKKNIIIDKKEMQFENALFSQNFYFGFYFIRMESFDTTNPTREIYTNKKAGQNWQIILPLLYSYKCYTLEENFFSVLIRNKSHSRQTYDELEPLLEHYKIYENTLLNTLDRISEMPQSERDMYKRAIKLKYAKENFLFSCCYNRKDYAKLFIKKIKDEGETLSLRERLHYILLFFPFLRSTLLKLR